MGRPLIDRWGVPVHAEAPPAVEHLDRAVDDLVALRGDPAGHAGAARAADGTLVLARVLLAYLHLYRTGADGVAAAGLVLAPLAGAAADGGREHLHLTAARAWAGGDWVEATRALERALLLHPRDLLALKVAQDLYFFVGHQRDLRDVAARVLPAWPPDRPGFGYVQGIYAFGLEEDGAYRQAADCAGTALADDGHDTWAVHALAHVFEMEGDPGPGLGFLTDCERYWSPSYFAIHLWWHRALFHLELGQIDEVLALYDGPIRGERSPEWVHMADAASLLWRLRLAGVDVEGRATMLADDVEARLDTPVYVFNDWHAVMALGLAGRHDRVHDVVAANRRLPPGSNRRAAEAAGVLLMEAFGCYAADRAGPATELLLGARRPAHAVGGSNAQRDVVDLTLLAAATRAGRRDLTRALVAERVARRPSAEPAARRLVAANHGPTGGDPPTAR